MGRRRKTSTVPLKEKSKFTSTVNSSPSARNLTNNELGAVIFGCKHHTYDECIEKKIFGLPASHYSYVKNVTPGLALFLFNYSDRMLHGIFKAESSGKMHIDQYAWITSEHTEITPYAAQVQVACWKKCWPLLEEQFKPIIAKNYYEKRLFWFELDKEQTRRLMELFLSSPLPEKVTRMPHPSNAVMPPHPPNASRGNSMFDVLSTSNVDEAADEEFKNLDSQEYSRISEIKENENSHVSVAGNKDAFAQEKKWTDLFNTSSSSYDVKNGEGLEPEKVIYDVEWEFDSSSLEASKPPPKACQEATNKDCDSYVAECWEELAVMDNEVKEVYENKVTSTQYHEQDNDKPDSTDVPCSGSRTFLGGMGGELKPLEFKVVAKAPGEVLINNKEELRSGNAFAPIENCERDQNQPNLTDEAENSNAMSGGVLMNIQSSDFESFIIKSMREIEGLKVSQFKQKLKIDSLEHELVHSKLEINVLKKRCNKLESLTSPASYHCCVEDCESHNFTTEESVLIVGGFDGHSWLPDLSVYSVSQDHIISLCSMTFSRSYASVAKLNGDFYIFGGVHEGVWYDTVESYSPISNQWVQQPSLNRKKGSLAGASVYEKIFAIGGGNGVECFSEVELFDQNIGRWIFTQSMLERRFAHAAADVDGALYVAGGYNGRDYLRSVERFDPREHAWTSLASMNMKRGGHCLVAHKGKLYALGGCNGDRMLPTVEVFDPRVGSWMMEEPMTAARGHFGLFVSGGKIYAIGGMQDGKVLDVIECYKEGSGWQVTGLTGVGRRCSFSTLIL